ncbi:ATP-binding cassette domain-containing protein [Kitasatospora aureofaciens]|uniref:ABC transporter domain-containing protein n=2 Tax=Kitasatospora aureofaciens TaxID=1894 RepID=A0A8H9HX16_KITAU|nr:ATP-binding cassette domain-containing protein [Kitasatospora aureofaciens]GGU93602.1 hypothetical protein GCM10010502_53860 [Kitasatospora aureofaciens]
MTDLALETDALGKRYGRMWALRDCSMQLPAGRIAALVGPNGAGKSTLLHLAVGLLQPDEGRVRVFGEEPRGNTRALADIGFVAQDTPLYRDFTATELITMGGELNRRWDADVARRRLDPRQPYRPPVHAAGPNRRPARTEARRLGCESWSLEPLALSFPCPFPVPPPSPDDRSGVPSRRSSPWDVRDVPCQRPSGPIGRGPGAESSLSAPGWTDGSQGEPGDSGRRPGYGGLR